MIGNRKTIPRFQSDFYRFSYYKLLRAVLIVIFINILLISGIIYFVIFKEPAKYYASTTAGEIIPLKPVMPRSG